MTPREVPHPLGGRRDPAEYSGQRCSWPMLKNSLWDNLSASHRVALIFTAGLVGICFMYRALTWNKLQTTRDYFAAHVDVKYSDEQSRCPRSDRDESDGSEKIGSCEYNPNSMSYEFDKSPEFSLLQLVGDKDSCLPNSYDHVRITGEIHVRPANGDIGNDFRVDLVVTTSDSQLFSLEKTETKLVLKTLDCISKHSRNISGREPFVQIEASIFVSPGAILQNFEIYTQSLSIKLHPGLGLTATERVTLSTLARPIILPFFSDLYEPITMNSREIIIHSTSGSVEGTYPLYDLLSITTISGSISISISPQEALASNPRPASLVLKSTSGSIRVDTPSGSIRVDTPSYPVFEYERITGIPDRDYTSSLSSASGSIHATLLHTSQTTLRTASGRIDAFVHPHGPPTLSSNLVTDTAGGSTAVVVYPSLSHHLDPLREFSASHRGISGSISLTYPNEWEGTIRAKTLSGALEIEWPGVTIVKDIKWVVGRTIEAVRGQGQGQGNLEIETVSGSAVLRGD